MARKKPSRWPLLPAGFKLRRLKQQTPFRRKTRKEARREDRKRSEILASHEGLVQECAALIESLRDPDKFPRSMPSARYVYKYARVINRQVLRLVDRDSAPAKLVTLIPAGFLVPADKLGEVNPCLLLEQIRGVLIRAGISDATGWAFLVLDMEYIEHLDCWCIHIHGLATRGVAKVIRSLKARPKFKANADHPEIGGRPVQLKAIKPGTEARVIEYLIKNYFGMRAHAVIDGKRVRVGKRVSVPDRRQAELLAWLARWKIDDFILTCRLYFGENRIRVRRRCVQL